MPTGSKKRAVLYRRTKSENEVPQKAASNCYRGAEADEAELYGYKLSGRYLDVCVDDIPLVDRPGFLKLMKDAENRVFDLVVCDSVWQIYDDSGKWLLAVRNLRNCGVSFYFAREQIDTENEDGMLVLEMLAAIIKDANIKKWISPAKENGRKEKQKPIPGYEIDSSGGWKVQEPEAKTIREIYIRFLKGETPMEIADTMDSSAVISIDRRKWWIYLVECILRDERYAGNAFLRKWEDSGEYTEYYLVGKHPGIIPMQQWIRAQEMYAD